MVFCFPPTPRFPHAPRMSQRRQITVKLQENQRQNPANYFFQQQLGTVNPRKPTPQNRKTPKSIAQCLFSADSVVIDDKNKLYTPQHKKINTNTHNLYQSSTETNKDDKKHKTRRQAHVPRILFPVLCAANLLINDFCFLSEMGASIYFGVCFCPLALN